MPIQASCPPAAELEQFLLGRLDEESSLLMEGHIADCVECQQMIATLAAEDDFVRAMRPRSRQDSAARSQNSADAGSDELANLLAPQLKRIATTLEEETSQAAGISTGQSPAVLTTVVPNVASPAGLDSEIGHPNHLGHYIIHGVLGSGGMGTVYHAFDPLLQRFVAIKVVRTKWLADAGLADRLVQEARAVAAVEHDNIVAIYAVETQEGVPCIVMPMLRGITLQQRLDNIEGPLPLKEILQIAREAANGLAAAHAQGLIHSDIKPANLWLEEANGRVKVLDFGLAKFRGSAPDGLGGISGTPGFLAPEQARGIPVDQRADIFSLGCVLYLIATGVPPYSGERHLRSLWTVLSNPPAPAVGKNPELPEELSDLISRMLAREPDQRPESMSSVLEEIDAIESRIATRQQRVIRRRWMAAVVVAAVMSGSLAGSWMFFRVPRELPPVGVTFVSDESDPPLSIVLRHEQQEQTLTLGAEQTLELSPGDYFVQPVTEVANRSLVPDRFTIIAGEPQTVPIAFVGEVARHQNHSRPVTAVAVLPGSMPQTILSVGPDRALMSWDATGRTALAFTNLAHEARCLALSPDGNVVATSGGNKSSDAGLLIQTWNTRSLVLQREFVESRPRIVRALAYSPDGKYLAAATKDGVLLWNLSTAKSELLGHPDISDVHCIAFSANGQRLLTGNNAGVVALWNIPSHGPIRSRVAGTSAVRAVAFAGEVIVATGDQGIIRIWDKSAVESRQLTGHKSIVHTLAVSPDGRRLLSGDDDGIMRIWSLPDGQSTYHWQGHAKAVQAVTFVPNGRQAVSGGADRTVRLWQLPFQ